MTECFICMETNDQLYKVCRCDTVVHALCLARLVNNTPSHSTNCPVCRQAYDISIIEVRRWLPINNDSNFVCISQIIFIIVLGISIGVIVFIDSNELGFEPSKHALFFHILKGIAIGLAGTAILCIIVIFITHIKTTGYICCYAPANIIVSREINLSNSRIVQIQPTYTSELEA